MIRKMNRGKVFPLIKKVIDSHDPEILLKMGCPADEYDLESNQIMDAIEREGPVTIHGLARIIRVVFYHNNHLWTREKFPRISLYTATAKELWKELPQELRR